MPQIGVVPAKYTGYYRCRGKIQMFKVRIRYRIADRENSLDEDEWHTQEFSWQEKHFSKTQRDFYGDLHNCITDLDKIYNEKIANANVPEDPTLFTYTDRDGYVAEQEMFSNRIFYLQDTVESQSHRTKGDFKEASEYDYKESVLSSVENTVISRDVEKMYIMADFGEYIEDVWIKNEQVLAIIKLDRASEVLSVWPDFSSTKPYVTGVREARDGLLVQYFVENCTPDFEEEIQRIDEVIAKVSDCREALRNNIIGTAFFLPPKNKLYVYLFIEILSGKRFDHPDLYLQYYIDLPENWSCQDEASLKGITQRCHGINADGSMHFGHNFEVVLEYDLQNCEEDAIPKTPYIYFEVISKTIWNCYRREGLAYKNLPIALPGRHSYKLGCYRFDYGPLRKLKRFFVGDCDDKDVKWVGLPHDHQDVVVNKFGTKTIGTGVLHFRVNVLHQSQAFLKEFNDGDYCDSILYNKLKASSLIRSVNQVLLAFKKARKNLIEVRQNL